MDDNLNTEENEAPEDEALPEEATEDTPGIPDEAFISPEEPFRRADHDFPEGAFIFPEDADNWEASKEPEAAVGVVTGMSGRTQYQRSEHRLDLDELVHLLEDLARSLHDDGVPGLAARQGASNVERELRAFLAGYIMNEK